MIEFRVLGRLEVWADERMIAVRGSRPRALLAILLLSANRVVTSDALIDQLWPGATGESAHNTLQVNVARLRKALVDLDQSERIVTRKPGYMVSVEQGELDLQRFERLTETGERLLAEGRAAEAGARLREALALWRGEPLEEFSFDEFAQLPIARLRELRLAITEELMEAEVQSGAAASIVAELEALVGEHPLRERPRALLMRALYQADRQADALAVYRDAREQLTEGLGIEPGPQLRALEAAILRQDTSALGLSTRSPTSTVAPGREHSAGRSIVVATADETASPQLLAVGETLGTGQGDEILVVATCTERESLASLTSALHALRAGQADRGINARVAAFTSDNPGQDLADLALQQEADLILIDAPAGIGGSPTLPVSLEQLLQSALCDVAVLCHPAASPVEFRLDGAVSLPFSGSPEDWSAAEIAAWLCLETGARLQLLGSVEATRDARRDASRLLADASLALQKVIGVACEPVLTVPGAHGILETIGDHGLLIVALSARWPREGLGETRAALVREARLPVLLVRKGIRPSGLAPTDRRTRYTWSLGG